MASQHWDAKYFLWAYQYNLPLTFSVFSTIISRSHSQIFFKVSFQKFRSILTKILVLRSPFNKVSRFENIFFYRTTPVAGCFCIWLFVICVSFNFVHFLYVKLVLSVSLKRFQECLRMFQNDLETRLLLSVLNCYLTCDSGTASKKEIPYM